MTTDHALARCLVVLLLAFVAVGAVHAEEVANNPPVIESIADKTIDEEDTLVFSILATDSNETQTLTYSGTNLPDGAAVNATTGKFSWTPAIGQAGVYENVRMRVTDGFEYNATNLTITVQNVTTSNHPPVIQSIANKTVDEEETLVFSIEANDADGDTLTFSGVNLPDGAAVNATTGKFVWTPAIGQAGIYENVRMRVYDGIAYDGTILTITVKNVTSFNVTPSETTVPFGSVTIKPETFNLGSMGKLTAFITIGSQLFSGNFDIGSLFLGGAEPVKVKYSHKNGGTIIAKYDRQDVADAARQSNGNLTLNTTITADGTKTDINSTDSVRIIDKEKNKEKKIEQNVEQNDNGKGNGKGKNK